MSVLSSIARKVFGNDWKTLYKAGYVSDDLSITKKGRNRVLANLLTDPAILKALVADAEAEIEENEKDCK